MPNHSYPIINLKGSPEIDDINEKIKQNYADEDDEYCSSEYNYYLNNEILSIIITQYTPTSYYYEVYNVNVNTGKVVSNKDLLKSKNIDETTFISTLKECCKSKFLEEHNNIQGMDDFPEYSERYTEGYNKSLSNCNMQQLMFLDENRNYKCNC